MYNLSWANMVWKSLVLSANDLGLQQWRIGGKQIFNLVSSSVHGRSSSIQDSTAFNFTFFKCIVPDLAPRSATYIQILARICVNFTFRQRAKN